MTAPDRSLPDPAVSPTISVRRAAAIVGCSSDAGYDAIRRGQWPAVRVGRSVHVLTARWLRAVGLADN